MARLRYNDISSFGTTNPVSLTNGGTTATFASAPAFPTIVSPDYAVIVVEPDSVNEEIVQITAFTSGATTATVVRNFEATQGGANGSPAHTSVAWAHGPTAADFSAPIRVWTIVPPMLQSAAGALSNTNAAYLLQTEPISAPVTVSKGYCRVNVQSGNIDIGIYSLSGTTLTRIASAGGIACPSPAELTISFTGSVTLKPGTPYYLAVAADNTTVTFYTGSFSGNHQNAGFFAPLTHRTTSGSYPLPSTIDVSSPIAVDKAPIMAAK